MPNLEELLAELELELEACRLELGELLREIASPAPMLDPDWSPAAGYSHVSALMLITQKRDGDELEPGR